VHRFKAQLLRDTLEQTGWNVAETAKRLDLARSHLYNLIGTYGIVRERRP
jgi:Nif-specific regulatory protein